MPLRRRKKQEDLPIQLGHEVCEHAFLLEAGGCTPTRAGHGILFALRPRGNICVHALWLNCTGTGGGHEVNVFTCDRICDNDGRYVLSRGGDSAWAFIGRSIVEEGGWARLEFNSMLMIGKGVTQAFYVHTYDGSECEGVSFNDSAEPLTAADTWIDIMAGHRLLSEQPFTGGLGMRASFCGKIEYELGLSTAAAAAGAAAVACVAATDAILACCRCEETFLLALYQAHAVDLAEEFAQEVQDLGRQTQLSEEATLEAEGQLVVEEENEEEKKMRRLGAR